MNREHNENNYAFKLGSNIKTAIPECKVQLWFYNQIDIFRNGSFSTQRSSEQKNRENKIWVYALLESLPDIDLQIERVVIVVYENNEERSQIIINPTEFDVTAFDWAIANPLNEPRRRPGNDIPLPLNHPYYSNPNYFRSKAFKKK
ncbi:hypothetical protein [Pedobacter yonginense]|nr:hypothetical protein [Pedobacter yonginense]